MRLVRESDYSQRNAEAFRSNKNVFFRRMLKLPWMARWSKMQVLRMAVTTWKLMTTIQRTQFRCLAMFWEETAWRRLFAGTKTKRKQINKLLDSMRKLAWYKEVRKVVYLAQSSPCVFCIFQVVGAILMYNKLKGTT